MSKYDNEFIKQQVVKKILDGQSAASVSRELGAAEDVLHKRIPKTQANIFTNFLTLEFYKSYKYPLADGFFILSF